MLYLTGSIPQSHDHRDTLRTAGVGVMAQPRSYSADTITGWRWAADNGCFSDKWDPDRWADWLHRMRRVPDCLWAVVPDVVGDALATTDRFHEWAPIVDDLGYPSAYVAQNGATPATIPWDHIACVFLGGDTRWKLSQHAEAIAREARLQNVWSHMGRVNSARRLRIADSWGVDSCDGTFLAFGPDKNVPRLVAMLARTEAQPSLFNRR